MWGKQKTPLLRGSCLNPLGGGYFKNNLPVITPVASSSILVA